MAATITTAQVKQFMPTAASVGDDTVQLYIDMVAGADQCLDQNQIPAAMQQLIKLNGIAHLLTLQQGGKVTAERDFDGASVNYSDNAAAKGLNRTSYGEALIGLDQFKCLRGIIEPKTRYIRTVGT